MEVQLPRCRIFTQVHQTWFSLTLVSLNAYLNWKHHLWLETLQTAAAAIKLISGSHLETSPSDLYLVTSGSVSSASAVAEGAS